MNQQTDNTEKQIYLGDGVFASYDGYNMKLKCDCMSELNTIILEPEILESLIRHIANCYKLNIVVTKRKDIHDDGDWT